MMWSMTRLEINRSRIWIYIFWQCPLYCIVISNLKSSIFFGAYRVPATEVDPHRCHFLLFLFRFQGDACLLFITQKFRLCSWISCRLKSLCNLQISFLWFYLSKSYLHYISAEKDLGIFFFFWFDLFFWWNFEILFQLKSK